MDITLRNLVLAGIGTLAYSYEKSRDMIDELVKKGELTVSQGKELNEELKTKLGNVKNKVCPPVTSEQLKAVLAEMGLATKQDVEELKARVSALENK